MATTPTPTKTSLTIQPPPRLNNQDTEHRFRVLLDYMQRLYATIATFQARAVVPIGGIIEWPNKATLPANYLPLDGRAVSRTDYDTLYTALGGTVSPHGQGDGKTTFNLPTDTSGLPATPTGAFVKAIRAL